MDRPDHDVERPLGPRVLIRINALLELRYLLKALIYQHKHGNINKHYE